MEPNFRQIADLFQVPHVDEPTDHEAAPRKAKGDTAEESDELGREHLSEGDWQTAIRHFREAISQREPGDITSQINLAGAMEYGDQAPQALRQYRKALQSQQAGAEPHIGTSDIYKRYAKYGDALKALQSAIDLEPSNAYYRLKLAETYRELGEKKLALQAAQSAVAAQPDEAVYHYWVGDLLIQMGRFDEALDALRAAIELSPGDDYLYLKTTVAFWGAGRQSEAIKALRLASDLDPDKHLYHGLLGILLRKNGQIEEALLEEERAKKMDRFDHDLIARLMAEMRATPVVPNR